MILGRMRRALLTVICSLMLLAPLGCTKAKATKETFCRQLRATPGLAEVLAGLTSDDPSTLSRRARQVAEQFAKLERSAPREIRSQVTEVSNLVDKIAVAVEESPGDPQAVVSKLRGEALGSVGTAKAALELAQYSSRNCHYDLNQQRNREPATSSPGATAPDSSAPATTGG